MRGIFVCQGKYALLRTQLSLKIMQYNKKEGERLWQKHFDSMMFRCLRQPEES